MIVDVLSVDCPDCGAFADVQVCKALPGEKPFCHDVPENRYELFDAHIHLGRFKALLEKEEIRKELK